MKREGKIVFSRENSLLKRGYVIGVCFGCVMDKGDGGMVVRCYEVSLDRKVGFRFVRFCGLF